MELRKMNVWLTKLDLTYNTKKTKSEGLQDVYSEVANWAKDFDTIKNIVVYKKVDVTSGYGSKKIPLLLSIKMNNDKVYTYQILAGKGDVTLRSRTLYGYGWESEKNIYKGE